jgi:hypothetical protein
MNRKLRDKLILVATCLTLLWCIPSFGQVLKGSISGTVVDQQGAVVSGAQVKATNTGTAAVQTTTTDNSGLFRFSLIPAGEYKIEISAQHFKTSVQNNVVVTAGRDSGLGSLKLSVGETSTTVEVTADAPLIETTQAQVTNRGWTPWLFLFPALAPAATTTSPTAMVAEASRQTVCVAATMTSRLTVRTTTTTA